MQERGAGLTIAKAVVRVCIVPSLRYIAWQVGLNVKGDDIRCSEVEQLRKGRKKGS